MIFVILVFLPFFVLASENLTPVDTIAISPTSISKEEVFPAKIAAYKVSPVRPQVDGVIKHRTFKEGSFVRKGTPLYRIDPTIYEANLASARANFESLEIKLKRYEEIKDTGAISKQEYDDLKSEVEKSKVALDIAKTNLEYTYVLAPISGYIGRSNVTEGHLVTRNQIEDMARVTQLDPVYADITIPVAKWLEMRDNRNLKVILLTDNNRDYKYKGDIIASEVRVNGDTDSVIVRAKFPNPRGDLLVDMLVRVKMILPLHKTITIPQRFVYYDKDGQVFTLVAEKNGIEYIVAKRFINIADSIDNLWIVTSGLKNGDLVIAGSVPTGSRLAPVPDRNGKFGLLVDK